MDEFAAYAVSAAVAASLYVAAAPSYLTNASVLVVVKSFSKVRPCAKIAVTLAANVTDSFAIFRSSCAFVDA